MTIIVPVDDFVGILKTNNRNIIILAILATALGMVFIGIFSGWISGPILVYQAKTAGIM